LSRHLASQGMKLFISSWCSSAQGADVAWQSFQPRANCRTRKLALKTHGWHLLKPWRCAGPGSSPSNMY